MLKVPATSQINRVEQCGEFCKKSLKMCSEHNEAKLICCFLSGNKYCMGKKKKKNTGQENTAVLSKWVSRRVNSCPQKLRFSLKEKKKKREEKLRAVFMHLHVNI